MKKEITIPKFTKEQKRANLVKGIAALRRNKKKARGTMRDNEGGRCCLCVLADSAERICGYKKGDFASGAYPIIDLGLIFGVKSTTFNDILVSGGKAGNFNDGAGEREKTHKEIASMLKEEYLK